MIIHCYISISAICHSPQYFLYRKDNTNKPNICTSVQCTMLVQTIQRLLNQYIQELNFFCGVFFSVHFHANKFLAYVIDALYGVCLGATLQHQRYFTGRLFKIITIKIIYPPRFYRNCGHWKNRHFNLHANQYTKKPKWKIA